MNKLIKLQLRNVFHNKLFYVCLGLMLASTSLLKFLTSSNMQTIKVFPEIINFLSSEVGIISTIFIALFCCFDFNEGTTKNIISRGYNRNQFLFSKYIVSLLSLFIMYIITILLIFILFFKNGIGYESNMLYQIINNIVGIIAYTIFFSTMSILLEKNGSAIIACLFVPTLLSIITGLIDSKLKLNIENFWLDNVSNQFNSNPTLENLGLSILSYVIYIVLFVILGTKIFKKKEIK